MSDQNFKIDERLAYASTLPSAWYTDPHVLELEEERVFGSTWQLVGRADLVSIPGQYFTTDIVGEPLIVARGLDNKLRAFSNVCRHRAGPVTSGAGQRKSFQCGYHGWTYSLDGSLMGTPEFEGVECWNKSENSLPQFNIETWDALVFVNLERTSASLHETLGELSQHTGTRKNWGDMHLAWRKEWDVECNWKVYVDNYLEGYHIPIVHPSLSREIDYSHYHTETNQFYSIQHAPLKTVESARIRPGNVDADKEAQFIWLFPNLMLNVYPDNYSTNLIVPLGPESTRTIFEWYFLNPDEPTVQEEIKKTIEFSDEIQLEDIGICEAVQRGLRSRSYTSGRYSVKRENGVHHFHRLLAEKIGVAENKTVKARS